MVVGHFHAFFVVFLFALLVVFILPFFETNHLPNTTAYTQSLFAIIPLSVCFFILAVATGLAGGLRRTVTPLDSAPTLNIWSNLS
jgi:hypothetical protein